MPAALPSQPMNPEEFANLARAEAQFWWFRGMRQILFRLLDPLARQRRIERVLDGGCGTGYFAQLLGRRYGWRVCGVERSPQGLAFGRQRGAQRLIQADITALPFPAGAFEAAVSLDVLVHFPPGQERLAIRELGRVLVPRGLLVVQAAAFDALRSRHSEFVQERQRFTRRRLVEAAEECGFRILRCTYANALLLPVALLKFRVWEPLLRRPPASGLVGLPGWLDRLLYLPLACEAVAIGAGLNLPLGQSLLLVAEKG